MSDYAGEPRPMNKGLAESARFVYVVTLLEAVGLIVSPWVLPLIHPSQPIATSLFPHSFWLLLDDFIGVVFLIHFVRTFRRLNAKIAEGGSEVAFLNWARWSFAVLGQGVVILLISVTSHIR